MRVDSILAGSLAYDVYKDVEICGVKIPAGEKIIVSIPAIHNSPNSYNEPRKFIPERWIRGSKHFLKPNGDKKHPLS